MALRLLICIFFCEAKRFGFSSSCHMCVLSSACREGNIPRDITGRRNLFNLIIRIEVRKRHWVNLCLNIPEMWRSDIWGCWPMSLTAGDAAALRPITATAFLVGFYCASAGTDSFILPMCLMHSFSKGAELSRTHLCLSIDHSLACSWCVCLPVVIAKVARCWMAQRCLSSLGLSQILGKRQGETHFYSYLYAGSVPRDMRKFNLANRDNKTP